MELGGYRFPALEQLMVTRVGRDIILIVNSYVGPMWSS